MSCGAMDENRRCKRQYPKDLRQHHPQLKCLSCGAVDTRPMLPPTYYGQRDNGCHESEKMPIFMAFLSAYPLSNRLGNGTTAWSTRHTQKRLCVWALQRIRILQRIRADCNRPCCGNVDCYEISGADTENPADTKFRVAQQDYSCIE